MWPRLLGSARCGSVSRSRSMVVGRPVHLRFNKSFHKDTGTSRQMLNSWLGPRAPCARIDRGESNKSNVKDNNWVNREARTIISALQFRWHQLEPDLTAWVRWFHTVTWFQARLIRSWRSFNMSSNNWTELQHLSQLISLLQGGIQLVQTQAEIQDWIAVVHSNPSFVKANPSFVKANPSFEAVR